MIHIYEKNYSVYVHVFPNNKCYVGITRQDVNDRWQNGEGYKSQPVYDAIKEYGWKNIQHIVLFTNLTQQEACEKEKELIIKLDAIENGYNITTGGSIGSSPSEYKYEYNGELLTAEEIADLSIPEVTAKDIHARVRRHGWSIERAMTQKKMDKDQKFLYNGNYYSAKELANMSNVEGITYEHMISRINKHGFDVERAMTQPLNVKNQPKGVGDCCYEYNGKLYNTYELCKLSDVEGLMPVDITTRVNKHGWTVERAITQPKKKRSLYEYNGKTYTSKELANLSPYDDIDHHVITDRINKSKWSVEKAIYTPINKKNKND